jgi:hypothetical protein
MKNEGSSKLTEFPFDELITKTPEEIRSYVELFIERHSTKDIKATLAELRREVRAAQDRFRSLSQERIGVVHWFDMQETIEYLRSRYRATRNRVSLYEEVERGIVSMVTVEQLNAFGGE